MRIVVEYSFITGQGTYTRERIVLTVAGSLLAEIVLQTEPFEELTL